MSMHKKMIPWNLDAVRNKKVFVFQNQMFSSTFLKKFSSARFCTVFLPWVLEYDIPIYIGFKVHLFLDKIVQSGF